MLISAVLYSVDIFDKRAKNFVILYAECRQALIVTHYCKYTYTLVKNNVKFLQLTSSELQQELFEVKQDRMLLQIVIL